MLCILSHRVANSKEGGKAKKVTLAEVIAKKKYLCVWQKGLNEYCFLDPGPYVLKKLRSTIIIAC